SAELQGVQAARPGTSDREGGRTAACTHALADHGPAQPRRRTRQGQLNRPARRIGYPATIRTGSPPQRKRHDVNARPNPDSDMRGRASAHPLAGQPMTGAEIVAQVLADEGLDVLFGYSGGAILPVYDAVFRYNERHTHAVGSDST